MVGLGEVLWDILPEKKEFGGAPANFAYHAKALGGDGWVVSCIGDDSLGVEILDRLDGMDINRQFVALDREHPTGTVSVEIDGDGKPTYIIHEGVAWDFIPQMPGLDEAAAKVDAVCFGSLAQRAPVSQETIGRFLAATKPDCLRIFDINLRQHYYDAETVTAGLEAASVLKLNDEELPVVAWMLQMEGDEPQLLDSLLKRFSLKLVALTKGEKGSVLVAADGRSELDAVGTTISDTVGAGDAFTAVVAVGMMRGLDLETINRHASRVAAYVCSQSGATPHMPEEFNDF
jgi:fructokinase